MAKEDKYPIITYYLYDYSGSLAKKPKKIYSPYNYKTLGRVPTEDYFRDPDAVEFNKGVYVLDVDKVGERRYEEQKEWLGFYNIKGGILRKGTGDSEMLNGRRFRNDGIHTIKTEAVNVSNVVEKKTIEKVNVQQIPKIIVETMNLPQLEKLANEWLIELPKAYRDGSADEAKKIIIDLMDSNGNIAD